MQQILPDEVGRALCQGLLEKAKAEVLVVGHTHLPAGILVGEAGIIVNPGALLRSTTVCVSAPGTFGTLELTSQRFTVFEVARGSRVDVRVRKIP